MRGAVQIAKITGIPVRIHWTFALILFWIIYLVYEQSGNLQWQYIVWQSLIILALFLFVVLHEFGHALTARRFGVKTLDIILSPIGGVARLDRMPAKPIQEFWVALAGPLVNFVISILLIGIYLLLNPAENVGKLNLMARYVMNPDSNVFPIRFSQIDRLFAFNIGINLILGLFNMIPAFPLDGGRIFRALLSLKMSRLTATRVASYVGQILVAALFLWMIFFQELDPIMIFIGLFVFVMAESEYRSVKWETRLNQYQAGDCINEDFLIMTLPTSQEIELPPGTAPRYLLLQNEELTTIGAVDIDQYNKHLKKKGIKFKLDTVMQKVPGEVQETTPMLQVLQKMREADVTVLPVRKDGVIIGTIDLSSIEKLIDAKQ